MRTLAETWYLIADKAITWGYEMESDHYEVWFALAASAMIEGNLEVDRCVREGRMDLIPTVRK